MTAKEEAVELVSKCMTNIIFGIKQNIHASTVEAAKGCALVVINEKIKYHESLFDKGFKDIHIALSSPIKCYNDILNPLLKRLKEVKQEIEKL